MIAMILIMIVLSLLSLIGLAFNVPFGGFLRDRVGIALGFFTPTNVIVRARILRAATPQFVVLPDRVQSVALQLGVGLDLGYGLRVGAGFTALAALQGDVLVANDASGRSTTRIDNQLVATYAPIVGASWERGPWRVGATYRGALVARFAVVISAPDASTTPSTCAPWRGRMRPARRPVTA